jgi:hypothetical protein
VYPSGFSAISIKAYSRNEAWYEEAFSFIASLLCFGDGGGTRSSSHWSYHVSDITAIDCGPL